MKKLAIASHVAFVNGGSYDGIGNVLVESLSTTNIEYDFVRHSMDGHLPSMIETYASGKSLSKRRMRMVVARPSPLRYITELTATLFHFSFKKKVEVYIGIDPLNALAGVLLKKLKRIEYCVFFTPDYSPQRFTSKVLNNVYHAIDRFCVRHADEIWCVSPRIQEQRRKMGLSENKNILVPNVPPAKFDYLRQNRHHKQTLIMYGIIDTQLDYEGAIRAVANLKEKYNEIELVVVGTGPEEERLKQLTARLKINDRVKFMGQRPLADTLAYASKAGIGLALYTGEWAFNTFGDSTKCREYFFFGLPAISTDTHATVPEIIESKAGIIVQKDIKDYESAIETILVNYEEYSVNAARLGDKYNDIHLRLIQKLMQ